MQISRPLGRQCEQGNALNVNKDKYVLNLIVFDIYFSRLNISPETIILYGQSIGTVPTVDLASRHEVGAVILHSPLMSGLRVVFRNTKRTWFFDAFPR